MEEYDLEITCFLWITYQGAIPQQLVTAQLDTVGMWVLACHSVPLWCNCCRFSNIWHLVFATWLAHDYCCFHKPPRRTSSRKQIFPSFLAPPVCRVNDFLTYRSQRSSYPLVACLTTDHHFVALVLHRLRESSPDMRFHVTKLNVL